MSVCVCVYIYILAQVLGGFGDLYHQLYEGLSNIKTLGRWYGPQIWNPCVGVVHDVIGPGTSSILLAILHKGHGFSAKFLVGAIVESPYRTLCVSLTCPAIHDIDCNLYEVPGSDHPVPLQQLI